MENELIPTLKLSLEMTNVLAKIEYNGLKINLDTLEHIRDEYETEMYELERLLDIWHEMLWVIHQLILLVQTTGQCYCTLVKLQTRRCGRRYLIWDMRCAGLLANQRCVLA